MPKLLKKSRAERKKTYAVASQIKAYIRKQGYSAGADVSEGVSERVITMLDQAIARTTANGRRTVRAADL